MKRKVIKQGPSTLMVSLPSKWVKEHNIEQGNEVELEEISEGLLIKTDSKSKLNTITVNVSGPPKLIRRYIGNIYRKGYDEITLEFDDPSSIKHIEKYSQDFLGLQITEQGKKYCVLHSVASLKIEEYDSMVNRIFLLILEMGSDVIDALKKKDLDELSNIAILDNSVNKLFNACLRIINRPGFPRKVYFSGKLLIRLEDAGDRYRDLAEYLLSLKDLKISKETMAFLCHINEKVRKLYELYSKFDKEKILYIFDKREEFVRRTNELLERVPKKEIRIIHILGKLVDDIYEASSPLFGLNL